MNTLLWKWIRRPDWNLLRPYCRDGVVPGPPNTPSAVALLDIADKSKKKKADVARAEKLREDVHERLQGGTKRHGSKRQTLPAGDVPDGPARGAYLRAKAEALARQDAAAEKERVERDVEMKGPQDLLNRSFHSIVLEGEDDTTRSGGPKQGRRATPQPSESGGDELTEQLREGIMARQEERGKRSEGSRLGSQEGLEGEEGEGKRRPSWANPGGGVKPVGREGAHSVDLGGSREWEGRLVGWICTSRPPSLPLCSHYGSGLVMMRLGASESYLTNELTDSPHPHCEHGAGLQSSSLAALKRIGTTLRHSMPRPTPTPF